MRYPASLLTNVCEFVSEHILRQQINLAYTNQKLEFVHWIKCTIESQESEFAAGLPKELSSSLATFLQLSQLRDNGIHCFLEQEGRVVWLFDFSETKSSAFEHLKSLQGLESKQVKSYDIDPTDFPQVIDHGSVAFRGSTIAEPDLAPASNLLHGFFAVTDSEAGHDGSKAQSQPDICSRLTEAISLSVCFFLAKDTDWRWLAADTCIRQSCNGIRSSEPFIIAPEATAKVSFQTSLSPDGSLSILANDVSRLSIRNVHRTARASGLDVGEPLILCPLGILSFYEGMHQHSTGALEASMIERFEALGFAMPADLILIEVSLTDPKNQNDSDMSMSRAVGKTVWPAHLAFCSPNVSDGLGSGKSLPEVTTYQDHIASAQEWFLGGKMRADAVNKAQKELEESARRVPSESKASENEASDIELTPPSPNVANQDMTGIYPTPSDGFPSQTAEVDQQNTPLNSSDPMSELEPRSAPNKSHRLSSFGGTDPDLEMFGANDLTEADFNFFDEPDIDGQEPVDFDSPASHQFRSPKLTSSKAKAVGTPAGDLQGSPQTSGSKTLQKLEVKPDGTFQESEPTSREKARSVQLEPMEPTILSPQAADQQNTALIHNENIDRDVKTEASIIPKNRTSRPTIFEASFRGSFNSAAPLSADFDKKYGLRGRYAFDLHGLSTKEKHDKSPSSPDGWWKKDATQAEDQSSDDGRPDSSMDALQWSLRVPADALSDTDSENFEDLPAAPTVSQKILSGRFNIYNKVDKTGRSEGDKTPTSNMQIYKDPQVDTLQVEDLSQTSHLRTLASTELFAIFDRREGAILNPFLGRDRIFIQLVQLLVDQVATRCYRADPRAMEVAQQFWEPGSNRMIDGAVHHALPLASRLRISDLVARSTNGRSNQQHSKEDEIDFTKVDPPLVSIQRNATAMDILHTAVDFWEELGLGPAGGRKKVNAVCLYPERDYLFGVMETFLHEMESTYQACNLGEHNLIELSAVYPKGQLRVKSEGSDLRYNWKALKLMAHGLGRHLANLNQQNANTVIYILDTGRQGEALPHLCDAFMRLVDAYLKTAGNEIITNSSDIVLQIVPMAMVFDPEEFTVPTSLDYKKLAFELYDRCAPVSSQGTDHIPPYMSASAIHICRPIPSSLNFKLGADSIGILPVDGDCIHLAYAWQEGHRWLTASWTDNFGTRHWNAAYWLQQEGSLVKIISSAIIEMWTTTLEILRPLRPPFRLWVAKEGPFSPEERTGKLI